MPARRLQCRVLGIDIILLRLSLRASGSVGTTHLCISIGNTVTARGRVLPEELTAPRLVKKFSTFYKAPKFITVFTTAG